MLFWIAGRTNHNIVQTETAALNGKPVSAAVLNSKKRTFVV